MRVVGGTALKSLGVVADLAILGRPKVSPEHEDGLLGTKWGDLVKDIREQKEMSQRELARLSGVSRGTIRKVEAGERVGHVTTLERLFEALGYEMDIILIP